MKPILEHPERKRRVQNALLSIGFDPTDWVRTVMYRECDKLIAALGPENLDTLEIAAGPHFASKFRFRSFTPTQFPGFDICSEVLPREFDLIIADQVFEHLRWPHRATRNVHRMLRRGGYFLVATPFLVPVHEVPIDCSRWTELGLRCLLEEAGFASDGIVTGSWGNRACVTSNLEQWKKAGWFRSLHNDPRFPVMVWGLARKAVAPQQAAVTNALL